MSKRDLWVEAYRPEVLDDVILSDSTRELLNEWIAKKEIPHFLFAGPPGTGKTTVARILVRVLGGEVLELNASDERGIDTVREKVKRFAMFTSMTGIKVVFLDEADYLTPPAQAMLRNMMEKYWDNCRFILTANYPDKILPAIRSRLQTIEFSDVSTKQQLAMLVKILTEEGIEYVQDELFLLTDDAEGDVRKLINMAQSMVRGKKLVYKSLKDTVDIAELWELLKAKRWGKIREVLDEGLDTTYVLTRLFNYVFNDYSPDAAVTIVGEYLYRDALVVDKKINLLCCLYSLGKVIF